MYQRLQRLLCLWLCAMMLLLPISGQAAMLHALNNQPAASDALASVLETRVLDEAKLLTASEQREVAQRIVEFQQNTGMDFVLITTSEGFGDLSTETYAETFYRDGGYGFDDRHSGIAYLIDLNANYHLLTTFGQMEDCMTNERMEHAVNMSGEFLYEEWYAEAVLELLYIVEDYYWQDYPQGAVAAEPTPVPTGDVAISPVVNSSPLSELTTVTSILLFLTSTVSALISVLTQF
ncbi:MAG: TPM domain-containing protein [Clostridia bacterium]|nr:TPM domain-containing protein [Clostridia bacterium]MBP3651254.1 TPM domain-containing protein [Clostridia bacterium]